MNNTEKNDNILPVDFDGVFRFTNYTKDEFKAKWDNIEYTFPPLKTIPLIIPGATPEHVQHIRKKFAKELAVVEFYKTPKFANMDDRKHGTNPAIYTDSDLTHLIQRCLEPLPTAQATLKKLPKDSEDNYKKNDDGTPVSRVLKGNESLMKEASGQMA